VTLNVPEQHNDPFCVILSNLVTFGGDYTSKRLKIDLYCLRQKCSPKNLDFSEYNFGDIL